MEAVTAVVDPLGFTAPAGRELMALLVIGAALALARVVRLVKAVGLALAVRFACGWPLAGFVVGLDAAAATALAGLAGVEVTVAGLAAAGTDPRNCNLVPTFTLLGSLMPFRASSLPMGTP